MRVQTYLVALLPVVQAVNIVLSNDDGWAEINIRQFYQALADAGESVIISAPAENQSGKGRLLRSLDVPATTLTEPCEYDSCPVGSPAEGNNASEPRFNYVNSFPVTSMRYGIQTLAPKFFDGPPDIAVAGFNVGNNLGISVLVSGTQGATLEAVKEGIPAIAFSGATGSQTAWNASVEIYETVYADLSTNVTQTLVASGKPYLPTGTWLNVNFPAVGTANCDNVADFKFVLSRIWTAIPIVSEEDVVTCGNGGRLPTESSVVGTKGCYASISVGDGRTDANAAAQAVVLQKLSGFLSCLPS